MPLDLEAQEQLDNHNRAVELHNLKLEASKLRARVAELEDANRNLQVDHDQYQAKYRALLANQAKAGKLHLFIKPE